jgi:hypothetical protein
MEQQQAPPKREWPKWLWGPDGKKARFDSPADIPRDYFETPEEARAYAESAPAPQPAAPVADDEMAEFLAWKQKKANMAKARAAKGSQE